MQAMRRVVCFGEALIDFLDNEVVPGKPRQFSEQAGGAPANVAVGVARLGGDARFVGMLAEDMFGDFLIAQLQRSGVDLGVIRRTDRARTALAFVSLDGHGERSFNFYRPPAADLLFAPGDFVDEDFTNAAVFHVCSNSLTTAGIALTTMHGMQRAARHGAIVSMDLNHRPALWPADVDPLPVMWEALAHAHLVKLSREELDYLARDGSVESALSRLFSGSTRVVVITDAAAPITWHTADATGQFPTHAVDVVDTTAAGDAFVAGLLHGLVAHTITLATLAHGFNNCATRHDLLRVASATGALATTRHGAFAAMPTMEDVQHLLEKTR